MSKPALVARASNILLRPRQEWPLIAAEPDSVGGLYTRYILLLSAIPALAGFIKATLIGNQVPLMGTIRIGLAAGLAGLIVQYLIGLVSVYLLALIIDALAPSFGAQRDRVQALKSAAYASTASWVAGVLVLLPWLGWLLAMAGGTYSIYLLFLGLPATMRAPAEKATAYTLVTALCAILLSLVFGVIAAGVVGFGAYRDGVEISSGDSVVTIEPDTTAGKLDAWSKKMEAAGKKMDAAGKTDDQQAQLKAAGEALNAMLGGGEDVQALSPEELKPFVPEKLGGLPRSDYSAERNAVIGLQVSSASAIYADPAGGRTLRLEITDLGGTKGLATLAGWAVQEIERESDQGYERSYHQDGRMVREEWNRANRSGSYTLLIGERYSVKVQGAGVDMAELKRLAGSLSLSELESLKHSGVDEPEG